MAAVTYKFAEGLNRIFLGCWTIGWSIAKDLTILLSNFQNSLLELGL
jgi:hypothetical protein